MQLEIYVPIIDGEELIRQSVKRDLAREFGGASSYNVSGIWENEIGELVEDNIEVIYTFADPEHFSLEYVAKFGAYLARSVQFQLKEDTVLYTVADSTATFV